MTSANQGVDLARRYGFECRTPNGLRDDGGGGASGIGLGVAKRIAAEGGRVTIWDMDPARLKAAVAEVGAKAARADEVNVADPNAVERATLTAAGEMGHIDILVCSAGVAGKNALVIDYPIDEWKRVFDINVQRSLLLQSLCLEADEGARLRPHRQHRLDRRQGGQSDRLGL